MRPAFEEGPALAASKIDGGADVRLRRFWVGVGAGTKPQKFGVVEMHPGVLGELQCGVQAGHGPPRVGRRRSTTRPEDGVKKGAVDLQLEGAQGVEQRGHGADMGRQGGRVEVVRGTHLGQGFDGGLLGGPDQPP